MILNEGKKLNRNPSNSIQHKYQLDASKGKTTGSRELERRRLDFFTFLKIFHLSCKRFLQKKQGISRRKNEGKLSYVTLTWNHYFVNWKYWKYYSQGAGWVDHAGVSTHNITFFKFAPNLIEQHRLSPAVLAVMPGKV